MTELRILFWNLNRRELAGRVASLIGNHGADLVVLAEADSATCEDAQARLASHGRHYHTYPPLSVDHRTNASRLRVLGR